MSELNRGSKFVAYYVTDPATPRSIFGQEYLNANPCGLFQSDGVTRCLTCFIFYKDEENKFPDNPGRTHAEAFDMDAGCGDKAGKKEIIAKLLTGQDVAEAMKDLKPIPKGLVDKDIKGGKKGEKIVQDRAAILTDEFLGFTLAGVLADYPEIWQPTVVDGVEVPNVRKCSWEEL